MQVLPLHDSAMSTEFQIAAAVLAVFAIYLLAKVFSYMRQSETQWREVDKTKLKEWQDDD
jgi:hypothetical protein